MTAVSPPAGRIQLLHSLALGKTWNGSNQDAVGVACPTALMEVVGFPIPSIEGFYHGSYLMYRHSPRLTLISPECLDGHEPELII